VGLFGFLGGALFLFFTALAAVIGATDGQEHDSTKNGRETLGHGNLKKLRRTITA
jgi:hypothetical protein